MNLDEALTYARDVELTDRQIAVAVRAAADDEQFKRDDDLVAMTHPKTGGVIRVHPGNVEAHEEAGWQLQTIKPDKEETTK